MGGIAGNLAGGAAEQGTQDAQSASLDTSGVAGQSSPLVESASQIAMQASQAVSELPQQLGPQQLMSAASQPMQQLTSVFTQGLGSNLAGQGISQDQLLAHFGSVDQLGMYGTSPLGSAGAPTAVPGCSLQPHRPPRCGPRRDGARRPPPRSRKWRRLSQRPQLPVLVAGRWAPEPG
ncbi:PPE domain protein [Mycobacterium xenopi 3993]|nr:PPE domain protein [Mycobacterium xenopi 3993]